MTKKQVTQQKKARLQRFFQYFALNLHNQRFLKPHAARKAWITSGLLLHRQLS